MALKLYVWDGIAFAFANSKEEAIKLILEEDDRCFISEEELQSLRPFVSVEERVAFITRVFCCLNNDRH